MDYRGVFTRMKYTFHKFEEDEQDEEKWEKWRKKFLEDHFHKRKKLTQFSSSKLISYYIPLVLIIIWSSILGLTLMKL